MDYTHERFLKELEETYQLSKKKNGTFYFKKEGYTQRKVAKELLIDSADFNKMLYGDFSQGTLVSTIKVLIKQKEMNALKNSLKHQNPTLTIENKKQNHFLKWTVSAATLLLLTVIILNQRNMTTLKDAHKKEVQILTDSVTNINGQKDSLQQILFFQNLQETKTPNKLIVQSCDDIKNIMELHGDVTINWLIYRGTLINDAAKAAFNQGQPFQKEDIEKQVTLEIKTFMTTARERLRKIGFTTQTGDNIVNILNRVLPEEHIEKEIAKVIKVISKDLISPTITKVDLEKQIRAVSLSVQQPEWKGMCYLMTQDMSKFYEENK